MSELLVLSGKVNKCLGMVLGYFSEQRNKGAKELVKHINKEKENIKVNKHFVVDLT